MIDVLLATYRPNEKWLKEQIASIRAQRGVSIRLLCREDAEGRGACANFGALLEQSESAYVAFSDQDDVWMDDKLAKELEMMHAMEKRWGSHTPLLVFTDARVVDACLKPESESLFVRSRVNPRHVLPCRLALQNVANGNTMLFNAALRDLAKPIPPGAFMHDAWLMLVASVFGRIACIREPTVLYRQHSGNVFGGVKVGMRYYLMRFRQGRKTLRERFYANVRQVEAFVARFGNQSPVAFRALVGLRRKAYPMRVWTLIRHRILKNGILRNLGTWAIC